MRDPIDVPRLWRGWQRSPFHDFLKMDIVSWDLSLGTANFHVPFKNGYTRRANGGGYHGGVLASIIDIAGDFALAIKADRLGFPTIDLRIDYLRVASNDDLSVVATTVKLGRTIGVANVEVRDVNGKLCTVGRGTYATSAT